MSSAALQTAPHQPTSLPVREGNPTDQYTLSEGYYPNDNPNAASPASSKRASRRPSANSTVASNPIPKTSDSSQASLMTSRTAVAAPIAVGAVENQSSTSSSGRRRHDPPVAPPRTSSVQYGSSAGSGSRRAARAEERATNSPRRNAEGGNKGPNNGHEEMTSRSRRTAEERNSAVTTTVRSAESSSAEPSRQTSEVLNQLVFSPPETDLDREQERLDGTQLQDVSLSHEDESDEVAPAPIVAEKEPQEGSTQHRNGRSRHDHSKKEKTSRFGDYYLGNTIGEGEFGKVKLGWKQDGGVQVRCLFPPSQLLPRIIV
jgi:protein-serine/threonine kinase